MEVSGQPHIPANLAQGKESQYAVKSRLGQLQNWFGKISCPCRILTHWDTNFFLRKRSFQGHL